MVQITGKRSYAIVREEVKESLVGREPTRRDLFRACFSRIQYLMEEVFDDTPSGPDSTQDVGGTESMNVDQPYLSTKVVPFQRHKFLGKVLVSPYVPLQSTKVKCKKRRHELKLNKSKRVIKTIVDSDGNEIQMLPWTEVCV
ncbi:hypothetical protein Tco_0974227 [Tanacetum coccineum]|uniref:Uncharacterized protein n=1 Tax=Tanacetum coccineum TaxID=301880 RepID=A0ABQ5EAZ8_9ASTR